MYLPQDFINKYEKILGQEAPAFFETFKEEAVSAFRINPLKEGQKEFADPIPSLPWSYYGKISGKSIPHTTGLVYSQEPAAQMVGHFAQAKPGMKVLDLAAAPGGKSSHLLSFLNNQGILVSNEISKKRSKILVENLERFGAQNVLVTNESADKLAKVFPNYFDMIVLDAPCSGEGMFRKQPDACQYWSLDYPSQCGQVQKEILEEAMKMLASQGVLVYSTCTWSPEENEDIVAWLLENYPLELEAIDGINGMVPGIQFKETARMYPHHFMGEGQYLARFRLKEERPDKKIKEGKSNLSREEVKLWQDFVKEHLEVELNGILQAFGQELYLIPRGLPDLSKLKIARNGLHLGTFKKKRFEPSFALGMALKPSQVKKKVTLSPEDYPAYVSGQVVQLATDLPNGWYQLVLEGNGFGFAKVSNQQLKNFYPKGLRFHLDN